MKNHPRLRFLSGWTAWLIPLALFLQTNGAHAAAFTNLVNFNSTDANPSTGLILSGNTLYGTTFNGGSESAGTIFHVLTNGSGFANFFTLTGGNNGANPSPGPLLLTNGTLFGATENGGSNATGMIFRVNTSGKDFTNLYSFSDFNGQYDSDNYPNAGLVLVGNSLYGTSPAGGAGYGSIFRLNTDGTAFTNLHTFSGPDGQAPNAGLTSSGNVLYGATGFGGSGSGGYGVLFAINTDGSGFTNFFNFDGSSEADAPNGGLVLSGNTLYGTAGVGGPGGVGAVFRIDTDGTHYTNLFTFPSDNYGNSAYGAEPDGGLVLSGNTLYGTAHDGGSSHSGTLFAINTDGSGVTNLFTFSYSIGSGPYGSLVLSSNVLYGTTSSGGSGEQGIVFALTVTPPPSAPPPPASIPISIQLDEGAVVLSWTNSAFSLWSAPSVSGPYTNLAGATSPYTNSASASQQYFQLIAN